MVGDDLDVKPESSVERGRTEEPAQEAREQLYEGTTLGWRQSPAHSSPLLEQHGGNGEEVAQRLQKAS